jgi:hypothetical protein
MNQLGAKLIDRRPIAMLDRMVGIAALAPIEILARWAFTVARRHSELREL